MCGETTLMYYSWILQSYPGKCVGLIMDRAPCHTSTLVIDGLAELNERHAKPHGSGARLVVEFIDRGLTSIHQPGDITVNRPLKSYVRRRHARFITELVQSPTFQAGQQVAVSRDKFLEFIEGAFKDVNQQNLSTSSIRDTFAMCGVNPFVEGHAQTKFKAHLDSLSRERAYGVLLRCNTPLSLELIIKKEAEE
jgi:hypothetical protein